MTPTRPTIRAIKRALHRAGIRENRVEVIRRPGTRTIILATNVTTWECGLAFDELEAVPTGCTRTYSNGQLTISFVRRPVAIAR